MRILNMRKNLRGRSAGQNQISNLSMRPLEFPAGVREWLKMRNMVFASPSTRIWTRTDFLREFNAAHHWSPSNTLMAFTSQGRPIGSVTVRPKLDRDRQPICQEFVMNWLMVEISFRNRGIGGALIQQAEETCWNLGGRVIELSTLSTWSSAVRLYTAMGYLAGDSPHFGRRTRWV